MIGQPVPSPVSLYILATIHRIEAVQRANGRQRRRFQSPGTPFSGTASQQRLETAPRPPGRGLGRLWPAGLGFFAHLWLVYHPSSADRLTGACWAGPVYSLTFGVTPPPGGVWWNCGFGPGKKNWPPGEGIHGESHWHRPSGPWRRVLKLHSGLPPAEQRRVFDAPPVSGLRKVVLSTAGDAAGPRAEGVCPRLPFFSFQGGCPPSGLQSRTVCCGQAPQSTRYSPPPGPLWPPLMRHPTSQDRLRFCATPFSVSLGAKKTFSCHTHC